MGELQIDVFIITALSVLYGFKNILDSFFLSRYYVKLKNP